MGEDRMNTESSFSIYNSRGEIVFFGLQDFIDKIAHGKCCFICGSEPYTKPFNNEHIIPDWILKRFNLYSKEIILPNGTSIRYDKYKVPCCENCNSELGEFYEKPISRLLSKPYDQIIKTLNERSDLYFLLFRWLCLMYLKTHLKDKSLNWDRNRSKETHPISKTFLWDEIHHIHCIARSHFTNAKIDPKVYGTIFILPTICFDSGDNFDYGDSQVGKGVLLRLGDFSIIAVLNDSCAGLSLFGEQFKKINGPVNPFQLREIYSILNFININLKKRPIFTSLFAANGEYKISVELPDVEELVDEDQELVSVGKLLRHHIEPMLGHLENKEQILQEIEEGKRGYLFDENGDFIRNDIK